MSRKWIIASVLIVILLALCGASLFAVWQGARMVQDSGVRLSVRANNAQAEETEEQTVKVNGPVSLTLSNDFGDVSITSGDAQTVYIVAEKTAWGSNEADAQKQLDELKVVVEQDGNDVSISVRQPQEENVLNLGPGGGSVKFTLTVPEETSFVVDSTNGNLTLSGTTGNADLQTGFGSVEISNVTGSVTLKTDSGNITATDISSKDDISLTSDFGNVTAERISAANVSIGSTNGTLDMREIQASGVIKASSDFGGISLTDGQAETMEIHSTNGKITMESVDVEGTVTVQNDFGDLILDTVDASAYDLQTQNGKIQVDKARGIITARSDFGDVAVLNVANGTIDLSSQNGAITFSGSLAAGPHSVTSDFGNVTLILSADSSLEVDLQTDFGKISSDFDITVSGALENNHWVGKFNGGGEQLTVKTNNGNITINSK